MRKSIRIIILLLMFSVVFTADVTAQRLNQITNIKLDTTSPSALMNNDHVTVSFDYSTLLLAGVRFETLPYTKGSPTPGFAWSGSTVYHGSGNTSKWFTVYTGDARVDQVRVRMYTEDWGTVLVEHFVDVEYYFGNWIINIVPDPASPATREASYDGRVTVSFDYAISDPDGAWIWIAPYTNGDYTPNQAHQASPLLAQGRGSSTRYFYVSHGSVPVDQMRAFMMNDDKTETLYEKFIPVLYRFCDGNCRWYVDRSATGGDYGRNWYNAFNHLQDALDVAAAGDEIWVAEGIYRPDEDRDNPNGTNDRSASFELVNGVRIYGGFAGFESSLGQRDWIANKTILSGEIGGGADTDNSLHVVFCNGPGSSTVLDGFVISDGYAEGNYPDYIGGGMYIDNGEPKVQNCTFENNSAGAGGGLGYWAADDATFTGCIFINNHATGSGGAVDLQHSNPVFRACYFLGNTSDGNAGAVNSLNAMSGVIIMQNCLFSGNEAVYDGGALRSSITDPDLYSFRLINCTLGNNTAGDQGGGIYNSGEKNVELDSCILWDNVDDEGTGQDSQYTASISNPAIKYSCIKGWTGGWGGTGNIGSSPVFIDADGWDDIIGNLDDNYHLQPGSPCIDTGNPSVTMNDPDGSRNDMGAFGGPWADLNTGAGGFAGSTFIFTAVGDTPTAFIRQSASSGTALRGTANVTHQQAVDYHINEYTNTPFGSTLWIYGLFGEDDVDVDYYKIKAGKWNGDTAPTSFTDITDTLYKTHYVWFGYPINDYVALSTKVGPHDDKPGVDNVYQYTNSGIWSHLDLRIIWNTRHWDDGLYTLKIYGYNYIDATTPMVDVTPTEAKELIILVDNSPLTCVINNVKYDPGSPYYDIATDGEIKECGIINIQQPVENLRFNITANHPAGHLRQYTLDAIAGKNDNRGYLEKDVYSLAKGTTWTGVTNWEVNAIDAILDPPAGTGTFQDWKRCAYQFRLRTWANITNGKYYVYWKEFSDHYFIDLGGSSGCWAADINDSGVVDFQDLAELSAHWLETCPVVP